MLSWAADTFDRLSQTMAPPPGDAVGRFLFCCQKKDETGAQGCLSELGDDPNKTLIQPTKGTYPLHLAAQHGMSSLLRQLMAIPNADITIVDAMGNTPLHHACLSHNKMTGVPIVRLMVTQYGASVMAKNHLGETPYDVANLDGIRQFLLPLQLQQETQQALDNGGLGLPPGIDLGGLQIRSAAVPPPPIGGAAPPYGQGPGTAHGQYPSNGNGNANANANANGHAHAYATSPPVVPPPPPHASHAGETLTNAPNHVSSAPATAPSAHQTPAQGVPPPRAPGSDGLRTYARSGSSSAAIAFDDGTGKKRFVRPDGFHSSSSDVNLQRKYGHLPTSGPPSGNSLVAGAGVAGGVPPPPTSGNSGNAQGLPAAAPPPPAAFAGGNPYARGSLPKNRYLAYDPTTGRAAAVAAPSPPSTAAAVGGFFPPHASSPNAMGHGGAQRQFTMFSPSPDAGAAAARNNEGRSATNYPTQDSAQPHYPMAPAGHVATAGTAPYAEHAQPYSAAQPAPTHYGGDQRPINQHAPPPNQPMPHYFPPPPFSSQTAHHQQHPNPPNNPPYQPMSSPTVQNPQQQQQQSAVVASSSPFAHAAQGLEGTLAQQTFSSPSGPESANDLFARPSPDKDVPPTDTSGQSTGADAAGESRMTEESTPTKNTTSQPSLSMNGLHQGDSGPVVKAALNCDQLSSSADASAADVFGRTLVQDDSKTAHDDPSTPQQQQQHPSTAADVFGSSASSVATPNHQKIPTPGHNGLERSFTPSSDDGMMDVPLTSPLEVGRESTSLVPNAAASGDGMGQGPAKPEDHHPGASAMTAGEANASFAFQQQPPTNSAAALFSSIGLPPPPFSGKTQ